MIRVNLPKLFVELPHSTMHSNLKCYILNRYAKQSADYRCWMEKSPFECVVVSCAATDWIVPEDAGLIVTHMHYRWEEIAALRQIYVKRQVPILVLADGILEYRNTWQNPNIADGAVFQPLVGNKLACIGRGQARILEAWGNVGKCEVVGLPRLSDDFEREFLPVQNDGPIRLLIATANTPAFTPDQHQTVVESLKCLKQRFTNNAYIGNRKVELTWRIADGLYEEVGLGPSPTTTQRLQMMPLRSAIELSDAVLTTPSTLYLESLLQRRPTAILDFHNCPSYVPTAWKIAAPANINPVLEELASPPAAKMQFQQTVLLDQLEPGNASTRLFTLMSEMIEAGASARRNSEPITLPAKVLSDPQRGLQRVTGEFDLASLYPDNSVNETPEIQHLRIELNHAVKRLGQLPSELDAKDADLIRKDEHIAELTRLLEEAESRIAASREREEEQIAQVHEKSVFLEKKSDHIETLNELLQGATARAQSNNKKVIELSEQVIAQHRELQQLRADIKELKRHPLWLAEQPLVETEAENVDEPEQTEAPIEAESVPQILKFPVPNNAA